MKFGKNGCASSIHKNLQQNCMLKSIVHFGETFSLHRTRSTGKMTIGSVFLILQLTTLQGLPSPFVISFPTGLIRNNTIASVEFTDDQKKVDINITQQSNL